MNNTNIDEEIKSNIDEEIKSNIDEKKINILSIIIAIIFAGLLSFIVIYFINKKYNVKIPLKVN